MINHGGAEFVVDRLAIELVNKGYRVTLFTDKYDDDFWGKNKNYQVFTFNTGEQHLSVRKWKKIGKMLSKELHKYDLINIHNHPSNFYWYYAKRINPLIKAPVVWYCEEPFRAYYGYYAKIIDKNTEKVRCYQKKGLLNRLKVSYKEKNLIEKTKQVLTYKFFIDNIIHKDKKIVNELDLILCNSNFTTDNAKKCFNRAAFPCHLGLINEITKNKSKYLNFILTISRLENEKNVLNIVKAIENLIYKGLFEKFRYIIAGKGPQFTEIHEYIQRNNLFMYIEMKGFISEEEKNNLYSECSYSINLPLDEPFGLVCLESYSYKKAIITSNHGGPSELTRNNETGLLVDPFDVEKIESAILKLLNNPDMAKNMGENGYKLLNEKYLFSHFIDRFIKYISEFLREKNR